MNPEEATLYGQLQVFFIQNQDSFYRIAFSYLNNHENTLDVIQDSIIKAVTKLHTLKQEEYMKAWFYRILINECITTLRKEKRYQLFKAEYTKTLDLTTDQISLLGNSIDLYQAIQQLEPRLKTIVILRFFEDLKLEEIALVTKTNVNTVKTRLYKALDKLKQTLGRDINYD